MTSTTPRPLFSIDPTTLREAAHDDAQVAAYVEFLTEQGEVADAERVFWLRLSGRLDEAESLARGHLARASRVAPNDPDSALGLDGAGPAVRLAQVLQAQGRLAEAEEAYAVAFAALQSPPTGTTDDAGERRRLTALAHHHRGALLLERGEPSAAREEFRSALLLRESSAVSAAEIGATRMGIAAAERALLAATPASYDHALHGVRGWWRGVLAIVSLVAGFLLLSLVLGGIAIGVEYARGAISEDALMTGQIFTPGVMLANNLSLALLLPIAMLLQWAYFGVRPRWLSSVTGGFRWRWFGRFALIIVPVWVVYVGVSFLLDPLGGIQLDGTAVAMLLVVLFTTPFQAAGEEYGARGLIQRAAGSWFRGATPAFLVGTLISGAFFTVAHGAGDIWLIVYYFVFAASMSLTARFTGGLEAPVLVHVVNNMLLLVPVALSGQTDEVFQREAGVGSAAMLIPMALCLAVPFVARWWAKRSRLQTIAGLPPTRAALRAEVLAR